MTLNLQAELGQEICALPFPQMHSCSHSAGGEPGPPLTERRELRCHWLLPAGGRDVYIPLKDMPRSFLATWWAEICHWSLPPWQSVGCKFMERPRARKWVRKQCDCWQTWRVWRCEELRGRLPSHKTRSHYPPSGRKKAQQDPRGTWRISRGLGLLGHIWEACFPLCALLEESLQAATVMGPFTPHIPFAWLKGVSVATGGTGWASDVSSQTPQSYGDEQTGPAKKFFLILKQFFFLPIISTQ